MAKNFPFFKFYATEWLTGNIVFEPLAVQGLFVNICALYWQRDGELTVDDINRRYKFPEELNDLLGRFISVEEGVVSINFLDEQLVEVEHISKVNSINGKKGALAKQAKTVTKTAVGKRSVSTGSAKLSKGEGEGEGEKKEKESRKITPADAIKYFKENGYSESSAIKFFNYYDVADWKDSKGNPVKSWKQKAQAVWFKEENKEVVAAKSLIPRIG
jgi:hypothetical protein